MTWLTGPLLLVIFLLAALLIGWLTLRSWLRGFSQKLFGTFTLAEGLAAQEQRLSQTPKSISSMTRLCLPQIEEDFPEFSLPEFIQRAENLLRATLLAISKQDASLLEEASPDYRRQIELLLQNNRTQKIVERYEQITVHRTEISRYEKRPGMRIILLQSAVGHLHYKEQNQTLLEGSRDLLRQTKYELFLVSIQDRDLISADGGVGITCPNCGAPVTDLGQKQCSFCHSAVIEQNLRIWAFNGFREIHT